MKSTRVLALALSLVAVVGGFTSGQNTITIGTGVLVNTTTTYPAPLGNWYWGSRQQFLYLASDLTGACAAGPTNINSISFFVNTVNGASLVGYTIAINNTATTTLAAWEAGLTTVYGPTTVTAVAGWNTFVFSAPFAWDGVSNLVVDVCFNNTSYTTNSISPQTATPGYISTRLYRADAAGNCGNAGLTSTFSQRPNTQFDVATIAGTIYQPNQGNTARLLINGVSNVGCLSPAITTAASGNVVLASNLIGLPWDVVLNGVAQIPSGITLADGQIVNVDFTGGATFLNGLFGSAWPGVGVPGATLSSLTVAYAGIPALTTITMQAAWVNPASLSGLSLSQAGTIATP